MLAGNTDAQQHELFRAQMLTEMARMSVEDGLVMQIHPGSARNHNRELYRFLKTMETYRSAIDKETWLVLSTSTDAFRYLQSQTAAGGGGGGKAGAKVR